MKRTEIKRKTPMKPGPPPKRTPLRPTPREEPSDLRDSKREVKSRSGGVCEAKGPTCSSKPTHVHHIKGRGFKGCHDPSLLLHVCRQCHEFIHAHPTISYRAGWMQRRT